MSNKVSDFNFHLYIYRLLLSETKNVSVEKILQFPSFHLRIYQHYLYENVSAAFIFLQLGPQQLKYMTVLKESSACLALSPFNVVATTAEEELERAFA